MIESRSLSSHLSALGPQDFRRIALAAALIGGMFVLLPASLSRAAPASPPPAALTVTLAAAEVAQWPALVEATGAIAPWQEAVIGAQVSGLRLTELRASIGDTVKRGQVLARFDADLLRAEEARLAAIFDQAEANRQRAVQLKGTGGISEQDVLQYVTQAATARAQLQSTRLQLRYTEVVAPDDGILSARTATLGAVANSGQELFRMIRQGRLEWRGELSAAQLAQVKIGQDVRLALPDGSSARARIRQLAPSLDMQTRLGLVYADLAAGSRARAGMYAKGTVVLTHGPALIVPAAGVVIRDGHSYVLKMAGAANRVALQAVVTGRRQGDAVEILSGLAAGDKIVVQGAGFLNDGDVVRIVTPPAATKG